MQRPSRLVRLAAGAFITMLFGCAVPATVLASGPAPAGKPRVHTTNGKALQLVMPLAADQSGLASFAEAVSTPGSGIYGQYESIAELSARFGASPRTRHIVTSYLRRHGAADVRVDATGLFVDATVSAGRAEKLFSTPLEHVDVAGSRGYTTASVKPSIPKALRGLVTGVVGLDTQAIATPEATTTPTTSTTPATSSTPTVPTTTPSTTPTTTTPSTTTTTTGTGTTTTPSPNSPSGYAPATGTQEGCAAAKAAGGFTPNQYLTAYGYNSLHADHIQGQGERVALIEIDGFKASDIAHFSKCFGLHIPRINPFGTTGVGKQLAPGGEATLDIEVLSAAAPYLKDIDVYEAKSDAASVLQALTDPLQHAEDQPQVISASLGLCEAQTRQAVGMAGIKATNGALEEATASGISVLAASGDSGSSDCMNGSGSEILRRLAVNFPASSAWVTSVGGTNLALNTNNTIKSSVVWNDTTVEPGDAGGGGFSSLFARPAYQNGTVTENRRAIPDVALLADIAPGYDIYCTASPDCVNSHIKKPWTTVGGTSAATPFLAGGFALIDQVLRKHKLQSLGLANPLLYKIGRNKSEAPSVFDDVTQGSNDVGAYLTKGGAPLGCCTATVGYDKASGWGGVNLAGFAKAAVSAQPQQINVSVSVPGGQMPYADKKVNATVSCSGACKMGLYTITTIGAKGKPFTDFSKLVNLPRAGKRALTVPYTAKQLRLIAAGVKAGDRITVTVAGAIVNAQGNVVERSSSRQIFIAR